MKQTGKQWIAFQFESDEQVSEKNCQNGFSSQLSTKKVEDTTVTTKKQRSFNFQQKLSPKTVSDLAVHPKKVKEVETWLQSNVINTQKNTKTPFLLITGPTGSGKTATVRVLCEVMSISLSEWINPMDQNFDVFGGLSQLSRFSEFLMESKWNSLFSSFKKKVILVEEFPNALLRNPEHLDGILEEYYYKGSFPVIFICTDSFDGTSFSQKLFSEETKKKYTVTHISFNSCAATIMKNALRRAHNLVQQNPDLFKIPSPNTVDAIIASSMGDIRCAINQYYFTSLLGTADLPTVTDKLVKTSAKRKRNANAGSVKFMARDENLGLFHGLGRVLNPKRTEVGSSWRLNYDIQKLVDEFSTQPGKFTAFLFENYVKYFGDINDSCKAAEILSLTENLLDNWMIRYDSVILALWISVLGLMIYNEHRVSKWNQLKAPTKIVKKVNSDSATRSLSVTDLFYYNIIKKDGKSQFNTNM